MLQGQCHNFCKKLTLQPDTSAHFVQMARTRTYTTCTATITCKWSEGSAERRHNKKTDSTSLYRTSTDGWLLSIITYRHIITEYIVLIHTETNLLFCHKPDEPSRPLCHSPAYSNLPALEGLSGHLQTKHFGAKHTGSRRHGSVTSNMDCNGTLSYDESYNKCSLLCHLLVRQDGRHNGSHIVLVTVS